MIKNQIKQDLILALKNKDSLRINILRYILSKFQLEEITKKRALNEDEEVLIIKKILKELEETLKAAEAGQRISIIKQTQEEIETLKKYLPKQLSEEELKRAIEEIIEVNQEIFQKNPKALIGISLKKLNTVADTKKIISLVNEIITKKQ